MAAVSQVHQLKITLKGIRPPIWRRIQVPSTTTLAQLHLLLQGVMGWSNYHLHEFIIDGEHYGEASPDDYEPTQPEARVVLGKMFPEAGWKFRYWYDFGDDWTHDILVEKILPADPAQIYPQCLTGKRACPPEDCGGPYGYQELLEILKDPSDPEHQERLEWLGGDFDPEAFDLDEVNRFLHAHARPSRTPSGAKSSSAKSSSRTCA